MGLSMLETPQPKSAPHLAYGRRSTSDRVSAAREISLDVEVSLPPQLAAFGPSVKATAVGNRSGRTIVMLGGISGNRFVCCRPDGSEGWWPGLVGAGCAVDPARDLVIGLDFAADPTGRLAPSTADQANVLAAALDALGLFRADVLVGASYGGMVALSFAQHFPERTGCVAVISAGAEPHPAATAARELQRRVVALGLQNGQGEQALAIARGMAMLTYRTPDEFAGRFAGGIEEQCPLTPSEPGCYLHSRGKAFLLVMTPERFLSLSASIDRHRADPSAITCPLLIIGAESDQLVPPCQLRSLAARCGGGAELHLLPSLYGHDMFLKEAEVLGSLLCSFLAR